MDKFYLTVAHDLRGGAYTIGPFATRREADEREVEVCGFEWCEENISTISLTRIEARAAEVRFNREARERR